MSCLLSFDANKSLALTRLRVVKVCRLFVSSASLLRIDFVLIFSPGARRARGEGKNLCDKLLSVCLERILSHLSPSLHKRSREFTVFLFVTNNTASSHCSTSQARVENALRLSSIVVFAFRKPCAIRPATHWGGQDRLWAGEGKKRKYLEMVLAKWFYRQH